MLKYIVIQDNDFELMLTFPDTVEHEDFSNLIKYKVVSAGFINDKLKCHGHSHSLGINSRPEIDTALLKFNLGIKE